MTNYRKGAIALVAALSLGLTACGGGAGGNGNGGKPAKETNNTLQANWNETPRDQVKDGGTFTTAIVELNAQMNPWQADMTSYTSQLTQWYTPTTVFFTPKGDWTPNPAYFTDVKSEDKDGKTVVTYKINEKAVYNDGTPIDYTALESGWKACGQGNKEFSCNSTDGYDQIESVKAGSSPKEAVVTFKTVFPWWKGLFNDLLHPKAVADAKTFNEGFLNNPHPEWGAGPYKIEQFDYQKGIVTFVRNEKWWGEPGKLDKRVFQQMEDAASINAFKNGQLDATRVSTKDRLAQVKDMQGIEIRKGSSTSNFLYTLNGKSPILSDIKVREALMSSIDRKQIANIAFSGLDYAEEPPGSFLLFNFQDGYKDNFGDLVKFDKDKANKLLDEAGWTKGADGIREKNGQKLTVKHPLFGDNPVRKNMAKALQAMLKDAGIDLQVIEKPSADFAKVIKAREFDVLISGFSQNDPFGVAYTAQVWASDSTLNKSGVSVPGVDDELKELAKIGTEKGQIEKANEIEKKAFGAYGLMPVYNGPILVATKKDLANYGSGVYSGSPLKAFQPIENIGFKK